MYINIRDPSLLRKYVHVLLFFYIVQLRTYAYVYVKNEGHAYSYIGIAFIFSAL